MLKQLKNSFLKNLNILDKKFSLSIFPRDTIWVAQSTDLANFNSSKLVLNTKFFGFDMFYYCGIFNERSDYFYFHASKLDVNFESESFIIVLNDKREIVFSVNAKTWGFNHFYSPQIIKIKKKWWLFFCAKTNKSIDFFKVNITNFSVSSKPRLIHKNMSEQNLFADKNIFLIYYTSQDNKNILLKKSNDLLKFENTNVKFNLKNISKQNYAFINNPSVIKHNGSYYLFCRISFKNALDSKIICFKSEDLLNYEEISLKGLPVLKSFETSNNTAFPFIFKEKNVFYLYYTKYWGRHFFKFLTLRRWLK